MEQNKKIQYAKSIVDSIGDGKMVRLDNNLVFFFLSTMADMDFIDRIRIQYVNFYGSFNIFLRSISNPISPDKIREELFFGKVIIYFNDGFYLIRKSEKPQERSVEAIQKELSFEGSLEGFVENVNINVNLVRKYYHLPNLECKYYDVGSLSKTKAVILYDTEKVDKQLLKYFVDRMGQVKAPVIQSVNELQQNLIKGQLLIPRLVITYRPDRAIRSLFKGKIIILLEGTPSALIAPSTFHDHFSTVDDYYLHPIPALFLMMLRYLALFFSIILPATYVAITSFNPEIFRVQLALSITASRSGVAYPTFIEVLFMLIMMEFLIEASIRLPKTIGQTATTVGGLILGQAATQAHLVSNIMIIIVAVVAISNFMIPVTAMNLAVRVMKYVMLFLASFLGVYGLFIGLFGISCYGFSIYCINTPFINTVGLLNLEALKTFFRREKL